MDRRHFNRLLAAPALWAATGAQAQARPYPSSQIRMIIGYTPGGAADFAARIYAESMSRHLGQNIVVENRPGAGSTLASQLIMAAQPDGYTVGLGTAAIYGIDQYLYKVKYTPADFTPVTQLTSSPLILAISPQLKARNLAEFVAYAKANPGVLNYSSSGNGGSPHTAGMLFEKAVGVPMTHVPFKGGAPALLAVAQGDVHFSFGTAPSVLPMGRKGLVRMLAVTSEKRSNIAPDLPTAIEGGLPGFVDTFWFGLFGPARLPREIVDKLYAAAIKASSETEVRDRLLTSGAEAAVSASPAAFHAFALEDGKASRERVEAAKIKLD